MTILKKFIINFNLEMRYFAIILSYVLIVLSEDIVENGTTNTIIETKLQPINSTNNENQPADNQTLNNNAKTSEMSNQFSFNKTDFNIKARGSLDKLVEWIASDLSQIINTTRSPNLRKQIQNDVKGTTVISQYFQQKNITNSSPLLQLQTREPTTKEEITDVPRGVNISFKQNSREVLHQPTLQTNLTSEEHVETHGDFDTPKTQKTHRDGVGFSSNENKEKISDVQTRSIVLNKMGKPKNVMDNMSIDDADKNNNATDSGTLKINTSKIQDTRREGVVVLSNELNKKDVSNNEDVSGTQTTSAPLNKIGFPKMVMRSININDPKKDLRKAIGTTELHDDKSRVVTKSTEIFDEYPHILNQTSNKLDANNTIQIKKNNYDAVAHSQKEQTSSNGALNERSINLGKISSEDPKDYNVHNKVNHSMDNNRTDVKSQKNQIKNTVVNGSSTEMSLRKGDGNENERNKRNAGDTQAVTLLPVQPDEAQSIDIELKINTHPTQHISDTKAEHVVPVQINQKRSTGIDSNISPSHSKKNVLDEQRVTLLPVDSEPSKSIDFRLKINTNPSQDEQTENIDQHAVRNDQAVTAIPVQDNELILNKVQLKTDIPPSKEISDEQAITIDPVQIDEKVLDEANLNILPLHLSKLADEQTANVDQEVVRDDQAVTARPVHDTELIINEDELKKGTTPSRLISDEQAITIDPLQIDEKVLDEANLDILPLHLSKLADEQTVNFDQQVVRDDQAVTAIARDPPQIDEIESDRVNLNILPSHSAKLVSYEPRANFDQQVVRDDQAVTARPVHDNELVINEDELKKGTTPSRLISDEQAINIDPLQIDEKVLDEANLNMLPLHVSKLADEQTANFDQQVIRDDQAVTVRPVHDNELIINEDELKKGTTPSRLISDEQAITIDPLQIDEKVLDEASLNILPLHSSNVVSDKQTANFNQQVVRDDQAVIAIASDPLQIDEIESDRVNLNILPSHSAKLVSYEPRATFDQQVVRDDQAVTARPVQDNELIINEDELKKGTSPTRMISDEQAITIDPLQIDEKGSDKNSLNILPLHSSKVVLDEQTANFDQQIIRGDQAVTAIPIHNNELILNEFQLRKDTLSSKEILDEQSVTTVRIQLDEKESDGTITVLDDKKVITNLNMFPSYSLQLVPKDQAVTTIPVQYDELKSNSIELSTSISPPSQDTVPKKINTFVPVLSGEEESSGSKSNKLRSYFPQTVVETQSAAVIPLTSVELKSNDEKLIINNPSASGVILNEQAITTLPLLRSDDVDSSQSNDSKSKNSPNIETQGIALKGKGAIDAEYSNTFNIFSQPLNVEALGGFDYSIKALVGKNDSSIPASNLKSNSSDVTVNKQPVTSVSVQSNDSKLYNVQHQIVPPALPTWDYIPRPSFILDHEALAHRHYNSIPFPKFDFIIPRPSMNFG